MEIACPMCSASTLAPEVEYERAALPTWKCRTCEALFYDPLRYQPVLVRNGDELECWVRRGAQNVRAYPVIKAPNWHPITSFATRGLNAQKAIDALGNGSAESMRAQQRRHDSALESLTRHHVPVGSVETLERASEPFLMIEDCAAAWRRAFRAKEAGEPDDVTQHLLIATDLSIRLAAALKR